MGCEMLGINENSYSTEYKLENWIKKSYVTQN